MRKRKALSLLLTLALCIGSFIVPAGAVHAINYFPQKGIPLLEELPTEENCMSPKYVICNKEDYSKFLVCDDGKLYVKSCTVTPSERKGYKKVTLVVTFRGQIADINGASYTYIGWNNDVYDYYTGRNFDRPYMDDDTTVNMEYNVMYKGTLWPMYYTAEIDWVFTDWHEEDEFHYYKPVICTQTNVFDVPEDYDGLVYAAQDCDEPPTDETFGEYVPSVYYAKNQGEQYFRFGTEKPDTQEKRGSDGPLSLYVYTPEETEDQDHGTCEVTNTTEERITGTYALLSYWPTTAYYPPSYMYPEEHEYFYAFVFPFDIDLAPHETMRADFINTVVGWSTMNHYWIEFEDQAELEALVSNDAVKFEFDSYRFDLYEKGIQAFKDIFGLPVYSGKDGRSL